MAEGPFETCGRKHTSRIDRKGKTRGETASGECNYHCFTISQRIASPTNETSTSNQKVNQRDEKYGSNQGKTREAKTCIEESDFEKTSQTNGASQKVYPERTAQAQRRISSSLVHSGTIADTEQKVESCTFKSSKRPTPTRPPGPTWIPGSTRPRRPLRPLLPRLVAPAIVFVIPQQPFAQSFAFELPPHHA